MIICKRSSFFVIPAEAALTYIEDGNAIDR